MADDIRAHALGGRGSERHHGDLAEAMPQIGELTIFRSEIMPPFADAMRLIDGDALRLPALEHLLRTTEHKALRCDIEQLVFAAM